MPLLLFINFTTHKCACTYLTSRNEAAMVPVRFSTFADLLWLLRTTQNQMFESSLVTSKSTGRMSLQWTSGWQSLWRLLHVWIQESCPRRCLVSRFADSNLFFRIMLLTVAYVAIYMDEFTWQSWPYLLCSLEKQNTSEMPVRSTYISTNNRILTIRHYWIKVSSLGGVLVDALVLSPKLLLSAGGRVTPDVIRCQLYWSKLLTLSQNTFTQNAICISLTPHVFNFGMKGNIQFIPSLRFFKSNMV